MNKPLIFGIFFIFFIKGLILANPKKDTYINTSNITYNEEANIVELAESTKINIENTNIQIDKGLINYNTDEVEVFGNFYLYQDLNILSGKNLKGDTKFNNFQANEISFIYNNDLKIDSDLVEKKENDLIFYNNFLTPCEIDGFFNCPTWSLRIDKTEYDIENDRFTHYDTFLQIADYKLFYLPYFSHYGSEAPRQKGFLTPSIEFTVGENTSVKTPFYLPIKSNMDLTFTPTIYLNSNLESLDKYKISTEFNLKSSGGNTELAIDNLKNEGSDIVASSVKFNSKQIINKNMIISTNGLFTNSVSATRSINTQPITFEDIYIKSENFNLFSGDDYLKSEISSVSAFNATDINQVPLSPSVQYRSQFLLSNNNDLHLELDYRILKRDESSITNPSENHSFNLNNILSINKSFEGFNAYNKIRLNGSHNEYRFLESNLNRQESKLNFLLSSDIYLNNHKYAFPRVKFIYPKEFVSSNNLINEDSNSISFNYTNQYSDNRFYGNDLNDNTPRIVYGLENRFDLLSQKLSTKINQSYDLNKKNSYAKKINQSGHFSDYAIELKTNNENINFVTNLRIDKDKLDKKEMSYSLKFNKPIEVFLSYNETDKSAFKEISQDTKALDIRASKKINNNLSLSYSSNMDLKNNYSPYSEKLTLSIFDECSKLDISYSNTRFNDNFNTLPEEKISLMYNLEYLGFLSEGENNLFK